MSRFKKILWIIFILIILGGLGIFLWWKYMAKAKNMNALSLVPQDAMYILESTQPIKAWKQISQSAVWKHLKTNSLFREIGESANALDSLINNNEQLFDYFGDHALWVSAHPTLPRQYDFLFILDIKQGSKIDALQTVLSGVSRLAGFSPSSQIYQKQTLTTLTDKASGEMLHFSILGNQLVCSYSLTLLKRSIDASAQPSLNNNIHFKQVADRLGSDAPFNLYIQGNRLDDYMLCYQNQPDPMINDVSRLMAWGGFTTELYDEHIKMDGLVNIYDSLPSYLQAMLSAGHGTLDNHRIITKDAAQYVSLGFKDFQTFYEQLEKVLQKEPKVWEEFQSTSKNLEKYLDISIREHFVNWIGEEVSYTVIPAIDSLKIKDMVVTIKAGDVDKMKEALKHIQKRIKRRTPFRFKETEYKGYPIQSLVVKGFFKVLFGKFFDKFDKPFYTLIEDRVVFSNQKETLHKIIDDYTAGRTLASSESFMQVLKNCGGEKANLFGYIQMNHYFPMLLKEVSLPTRNSMLKNKAYFECFTHTGFRLDGQENHANVNMDLLFQGLDSKKNTDADEQVDSLAEDSLAHPFVIKDGKKTSYYENGQILTEVEVNEEGIENGTYKEFYPDGELKVKGKFQQGKKSGTWRYYNPDGDLERKEDMDEVSQKDSIG